MLQVKVQTSVNQPDVMEDYLNFKNNLMLFARVVSCETKNNELTVTNGRYQITRMLPLWSWALALFVISPCLSYSNILQGKHLRIYLSEVIR